MGMVYCSKEFLSKAVLWTFDRVKPWLKFFIIKGFWDTQLGVQRQPSHLVSSVFWKCHPILDQSFRDTSFSVFMPHIWCRFHHPSLIIFLKNNSDLRSKPSLKKHHFWGEARPSSCHEYISSFEHWNIQMDVHNHSLFKTIKRKLLEHNLVLRHLIARRFRAKNREVFVLTIATDP